MLKADGLKVVVDGTAMVTGMELGNMIRTLKEEYVKQGMDDKTAAEMIRMATEMGLR